ncbi:MAG: NDP-hexose 2,3-dehydratase family protein [Candidatus Marinimicrobia bacterium]|nr:NDP-hexose 2,3-dehydratase family protein [Candidatus Neomarinimicrobiota bacterium]
MKEKSHLKIDRINFSEQKEWIITQSGITHYTGGYFNVTGIKSEFSGDEQVVFYQPQSALTGLLMCQIDNQIFIQTQARVEPGVTGDIQYGPTIQTTAANYMKYHGGKPTSNLEMFHNLCPQTNLISFSMQLDLGEKYYKKSKSHHYIETQELSETSENLVWVPLEVIAKTLTKDYFLNTDFRSLLAVFDWDAYLKRTRGNNPPLSSEILTDFFKRKNSYKNSWKISGIDKLTGWQLTDEGIKDHCNSGVSVNMYNITCDTREVQSWNQPLMEAKGTGQVVLLMRKLAGEYEFLLSIIEEFGLNESIAIGPSFLNYPKMESKKVEIPGDIVKKFQHSDEGGRFYHNDSKYVVYEVDQNYPISDGQYWVNGFTLKKILAASNMAAIQLRCICSAVLKELNPNTF